MQFAILHKMSYSRHATCLLFMQTEKISSLISELGLIAAQEKVLLEECASLLAMLSALEVRLLCIFIWHAWDFTVSYIESNEIMLERYGLSGRRKKHRSPLNPV